MTGQPYETSDRERAALRARNLRTLAAQEARPAEVAALLGVPVHEVEWAYRALGVELPCPACGRPRPPRSRGRRLKKTCGDASCRATMSGRSTSGPRRPLTRAHRKRIGAGLRRYWDAHPEGQPPEVRARISEGQQRRWARQNRRKMSEGDGSLEP